MIREEAKKAKRHWRAILYILLAIFLIVTIIYAAGMLVQVGDGCYQLILHPLNQEGAFDYGFPKIYWAYQDVVPYTFTTAGLIVAAVLAVITLVMIFGRRGINRTKETVSDERGFKGLTTGMYGTAEWMTEEEAREVLKVIPESTGRESVLGTNSLGELICLPDNIMGDNQNMIVFGPPGTGKTRCIILNHIIGAINRGESVIVPDTKGELYNITSEYARRQGYQVRVLNLIDPDHSDSWNVLSGIDLDMDVSNIAQTITNNSGTNAHSDPFWTNSELNLLKAVMLHVLTKEDESCHNLPFIYNKILQGIDGLTRYITGGEGGGGLTEQSAEWAAWSIFSQNVKDTTQGSFIQGLATRLQILQNPKVSSILQDNTIDLSLPAHEKCAYYMILDTQNSNMEFLSSLFFNFLFERLIHWADTEGKGRCKVPVRIILDEFTNLGRLGVAPDGSDFVQTLSLTRSRFINATMAVQTLGQLQTKYPRELSSALLGNTAYWLLLGCNDDLTAKLFSDRSGDMTVEVKSERTSRKNLTPYQWIPEYQQTEGAGKRKLITPDEVQRMKQVYGDRTLLISMEGHNMLRAEKFDYTKNASYHSLIKGDIGKYGTPQPPPTTLVAETEQNTEESEQKKKRVISRTKRSAPAGGTEKEKPAEKAKKEKKTPDREKTTAKKQSRETTAAAGTDELQNTGFETESRFAARPKTGSGMEWENMDNRNKTSRETSSYDGSGLDNW